MKTWCRRVRYWRNFCPISFLEWRCFISTFWYFLFGGHRRNDIDRDTQTSQWKQSHFIEEKHFQKHYRPISSHCSLEKIIGLPWKSQVIVYNYHILGTRESLIFSDPFLCHFASAELNSKLRRFLANLCIFAPTLSAHAWKILKVSASMDTGQGSRKWLAYCLVALNVD